MELLRDPNLADRIVGDVEGVGVVGESTNVLVAYLSAVSRKLDTRLAVLVQSTSAADRSSLMEAVLGLVPPEDRVSFSAVTVGEHDLMITGAQGVVGRGGARRGPGRVFVEAVAVRG